MGNLADNRSSQHHWAGTTLLKGEWFDGTRRWKKRDEDRFSQNELLQEEH